VGQVEICFYCTQRKPSKRYFNYTDEIKWGTWVAKQKEFDKRGRKRENAERKRKRKQIE
jgi:hypothetical protein